MAAEGRWEFERNIGTGGFGLVKLFTNQVMVHATYPLLIAVDVGRGAYRRNC